MSNEVINVQQLPKETVAKFVNDAAEMETSSFALKQMADETEKQANAIKWSATNNLKKSQESVESAKHRLEDAKKKRDIVCKEANSFKFEYSIWAGMPWGWIIGSCFLGGWQLLLFILGSVSIMIYDNMEDNVYYVVLTIASLIVYLVVAIAIANRIKKSKAQRKYKDELNIKISTARTAELYTNQCQDEYDSCIRVNNKQIQTSREKEKTSQELQNHAVMLRQQASDIDSMLKQHYSIGIIPPDYRDMIRVLYIQRAYRNDQVDTMREATLLCDRDVYHIEIKNGLSEIADAIKSLSSTLSEINWNITRMNSELRDIANGQERIITETESARYATEAVQKSQESLLWYEQQKWYRSNS